MAKQILILLLVYGAGYASQRGRTCAVSAAFEIAKKRRARRFVGFLFAAACSLVVLSIVSVFDPALFGSFKSEPPTYRIVIGGMLFALGAYINGRCSLGTIARLGSGELVRLGSLAGIFFGILVGAYMTLPTQTGTTRLLFDSNGPSVRIGLALAFAAVFGLTVHRTVPKTFNTSQWPIWRSMALIGTANGLLVWLGRDWSYTTLFGHIARGNGTALWFGLLCFLTLIAGAISAGLASHQFAVKYGTLKEWLQTVAGGFLMGVGVILIPGGNDTMLLVGLPLLLPHLILGYAIMYATLIGIAVMTPNTDGTRVNP